MQRNAKTKKPKRRWRFRGVCADAKTLGVHRNTLYKVLAGVWKSRSLTERYRALKSEKSTPSTIATTNEK